MAPPGINACMDDIYDTFTPKFPPHNLFSSYFLFFPLVFILCFSLTFLFLHHPSCLHLPVLSASLTETSRVSLLIPLLLLLSAVVSCHYTCAWCITSFNFSLPLLLPSQWRINSAVDSRPLHNSQAIICC